MSNEDKVHETIAYLRLKSIELPVEVEINQVYDTTFLEVTVSAAHFFISEVLDALRPTSELVDKLEDMANRALNPYPELDISKSLTFGTSQSSSKPLSPPTPNYPTGTNKSPYNSPVVVHLSNIVNQYNTRIGLEVIGEYSETFYTEYSLQLHIFSEADDEMISSVEFSPCIEEEELLIKCEQLVDRYLEANNDNFKWDA